MQTHESAEICQNANNESRGTDLQDEFEFLSLQSCLYNTIGSAIKGPVCQI